MSDYRDYAARRLRPEERRGVMHMDMLSRSFRLAACDLGKRLEGYKNQRQYTTREDELQ